MDRITPTQRSAVMAAIRGKDTRPEMIVRRLVHQLGYRFRLHRRDLPGTPDIVLPGLRKIVNVHGCFWHGHYCRNKRRKPATNKVYWQAKVERNRSRDQGVRRRLQRAGWRVMTIWECQTNDLVRLGTRIARFLEAE